MRSLLLVGLVALGACHPRLSMGYDMSAHVNGPLAGLQTIPRLAAIPGAPAPQTLPPEGTNYSAGIAFGNRRLVIGVRAHANNISGSTLDLMQGPRYLSGAAAVDARYTAFQWRQLSAIALLAPSYTLLADSARMERYYGQGMRYGGSLEFALSAIRIYADVYQEKLFFGDGPAQGVSTRSGVTIGVGFQP